MASTSIFDARGSSGESEEKVAAGLQIERFHGSRLSP